MHLYSVTFNVDTLYINGLLHIRNKDIFLLDINYFYTNFYYFDNEKLNQLH